VLESVQKGGRNAKIDRKGEDGEIVPREGEKVQGSNVFLRLAGEKSGVDKNKEVWKAAGKGVVGEGASKARLQGIL